MLKKFIALICALSWLILLVDGICNYCGSKAVYVMFSLVYLVMLLSAFCWKFSYGYLFLVIFLGIGFWLKLAVHILSGSPYTEPVGSFNGTAAAWDEILLVALVASVGVMVGRILYGLVRERSIPIQQEKGFKAPVWYPATRKWLWSGMITLILSIAILNSVLSIHQIGLVPRTILIWPLNAVIAWMLNIGLATGVATLLWWDICLKKKIFLLFCIVLIEAFS